ncbi:hypothetical protein COOONC_22431 [Cooperia oncophora]
MSGPKAPTGAASKPLEPTKYDLQVALRRFQEAFLLYPSGVVDVPTLAKMSEYRCANRDISSEETSLEQEDATVVPLRKSVVVDSGPNKFGLLDLTRPINSQIILVKHHLWGYRNHEPRGISLFHTLLHEIGHALGLPHNFYRG